MRASEAGSRSGEAPLQIGFYTRRWDPQVPVLREICYPKVGGCVTHALAEKQVTGTRVAGLRSRTRKAKRVPSKRHGLCAIRVGIFGTGSSQFLDDEDCCGDSPSVGHSTEANPSAR